MISATEEPLFRNQLVGNITEQVARRPKVTVVMAKRRSSKLRLAHSIPSLLVES